MLHGKKILLGVTGSIAAYKAAGLIRLFIKEGADVQVVMSKSATDFITPLTLSTLSKRPVLIEPFHSSTGEWYSHVDWALWADFFLIAPLTANTLAKLANGQADNLLVAIYLAARCPVFFAPAMDVDMFEHPSTQKNISILEGYGNILIPPQVGELASGLSGKGRLDEPENIVGFLQDWFKKKSPLTNKVALVTAGPTFERIDPVRFIGNFSSGKMGFAIAETLAEQGARVILISGPTALTTTHTSIELHHVESAAEMHEACMRFQPESDVIVMAAAVADYTPATVSDQKLKKESGIPLLELKPTVDILADLGSHKITGQMLVGFALETHDALEHAQKKLQNKNLDLIVLNSLEDQGAGFGVDTNKITIIDKHKNIQTYSLKSKKEVALDIVNKINDLLNF